MCSAKLLKEILTIKNRLKKETTFFFKFKKFLSSDHIINVVFPKNHNKHPFLRQV